MRRIWLIKQHVDRIPRLCLPLIHATAVETENSFTAPFLFSRRLCFLKEHTGGGVLLTSSPFGLAVFSFWNITWLKTKIGVSFSVVLCSRKFLWFLAPGTQRGNKLVVYSFFFLSVSWFVRSAHWISHHLITSYAFLLFQALLCFCRLFIPLTRQTVPFCELLGSSSSVPGFPAGLYQSTADRKSVPGLLPIQFSLRHVTASYRPSAVQTWASNSPEWKQEEV